MLFHPFQILSVEPVRETALPPLTRSVCGVLCCPEGQGNVTVGTEEIPLRSGVCLFIHAAEPVSFAVQNAAFQAFWISMKINHVDLQQALADRILRLPCAASALKAAYDYDRSTESFYDTLSQLLERTLFELITDDVTENSYPSGSVLDASANSPELSKFFSALHAYLDENLQNDFTAAQLADAMGCSHRHLNHLLQKHCSCTSREFINNFRVQRAKLYLLSSDNTITEIARLTGFNSVHYFSRVFKKIIGMSPQAFRSSFASPHPHR